MSLDWERLESDRARTWTMWAGRLLVGIGLLHIAFFTVHTWRYWSGWITGDLRGSQLLDAAPNLSHEGFWALPGSFTAPLMVLGVLATRMAKARLALPGYVGWTLAAWVVLCSLICEPSGFPLGLAPAALFIAAHHRQVKWRRDHGLGGTSSAPGASNVSDVSPEVTT